MSFLSNDCAWQGGEARLGLIVMTVLHDHHGRKDLEAHRASLE